MNKLTLGSLFDGSGGFPLGGLISGIQPVWASEIEPFPIRMTTKRKLFRRMTRFMYFGMGRSCHPIRSAP